MEEPIPKRDGLDTGNDGELPNITWTSVEDVLFYLLEKGVPEHLIWGYDDGWDFERLLRAYYYFQARDVEKHEQAVLAVSIGASTLVSPKVIKQFLEGNEDVKMVLAESRAQGDTGAMDRLKAERQRRVYESFQGLVKIVTGDINWEKDAQRKGG